MKSPLVADEIATELMHGRARAPSITCVQVVQLIPTVSVAR